MGHTCTTVVHRAVRGTAEWWAEATVYEFAYPLDIAGLQTATNNLMQAAQLGADAVSVRPGLLNLDTDSIRLQNFINQAHQLGFRVLVRLAGTTTMGGVYTTPYVGYEGNGPVFLDRARKVAQMGADGIDFGCLAESSLGNLQGTPVEFSAFALNVQAELAAANSSAIVSAAASCAPQELHRHLEEEWFHHLRDDRLETAEWSAPALQRTITDIFSQRSAIGQVMTWTTKRLRPPAEALADPLSVSQSPELTAKTAALTFLILALPGAIYLRQGDEFALHYLTQAADYNQFNAAYYQADKEQRNVPGSYYEQIRQALRLRKEFGQANRSLAVVENLPWANPGLLVLTSSKLTIVVNPTPDPWPLPSQEVLLASAPLVRDDTGRVLLRPNSTAWLQPQQRP